MNRLFIAAAVVLSTGSLAFAGPTKHVKPAAKPAAKPNLVCPVMNSKIPSVKAASGKSVYKGKTYYFCCGSCKPAFDKNPAKYVKEAKAKPAPKAHHH